METKANYLLIGIFALVGFAGVLGFFLTFGAAGLTRDMARYEARFDTISGLMRGADVRFAGLSVGQVTEVSLQPDGQVRVRFDAARTAPVRADSIASVESSGLTGVSHLALSTGSDDAALVNDQSGVVLLDARRSGLQSVTDAAPQILDEALRVIGQVNRLLGDENQARVSGILQNMEAASGDLSAALQNFAGFTDTIAAATDTFTEFSENLAPLLLQSEKTLESLQFAIDEAALVATEARQTFEAGTQTLQGVDTFVTDDLTKLVADLRTSADTIRAELTAFSSEAQVMFDQISRTGAAATQRIEALDPALSRLDPLLAQAENTLATLEQMAGNVDNLVTGDAAALVAEARATMDATRRAAERVANVAETDLPLIVADIRAATTRVAEVVDQVGTDLSGASGRIDALGDAGLRALDQVTETFGNANTTLDAINRALETGERTLEAAERTFAGADRVINEEIGQITADLRDVLGRLGNAVDSVSSDIPEVTADLRRTADSAARMFDDLGRMVRDTQGPVRDFTSSGLPNITQLARETRGLISNLDRLTRQIERDPARFLLGGQTPEFRR